MIQSLIQHLTAVADALDAEAERDCEFYGAAARVKTIAAGTLRRQLVTWLEAELDLQQAMAETGHSDTWLRRAYESTGEGRQRRWMRRDLLDAHVAAEIPFDTVQAEELATEDLPPVPTTPQSAIDLAVQEAAAHLNAA